MIATGAFSYAKKSFAGLVPVDAVNGFKVLADDDVTWASMSSATTADAILPMGDVMIKLFHIW